MKTILVVSDIHYPDRISKIPDLSLYIKDVDAIFALGDFTSFDVLKYLDSFGKAVYSVYGNMDEMFIKSHLRDKFMLEIEGVSIALTHGNGGPSGIEERVSKMFNKKFDAYIFGHTHQSLNEYVDDVLFFNPGAISHITPSLGFLYVENKNVWGKIVFL